MKPGLNVTWPYNRVLSTVQIDLLFYFNIILNVNLFLMCLLFFVWAWDGF